MRRVVVSEFVTLDGVMEDPGGAEGFERGGWAFQFERGPDGDRFKSDELFASDALLLGRVTYQGFAKAWPSRSGDAFSDKMNSMRKYVVSATLTDADATWNSTTVLRGDVASEVRRLKDEPGGDLLVAGSRRLVQGLTDADLVDEYRLMVYPIVLGMGNRLFPDLKEPRKLKLTSAKPAGDGIQLLTYEPIRVTSSVVSASAQGA